jgi:hypothetical protein
MPDLPWQLIDSETGEHTDYEGVVVPIEDLTATSVEFFVDPKHKDSSYAEALNKLLHELWGQISERVKNDFPGGSYVRITAGWDVEIDIKEIER